MGDLKDSHSRVVLNSLTVNGTSMLSAVLRVQGDEGQFSLALSRQELGDYEVEYEAVDDAGNEVEGDIHLQRGAEGAVRSGLGARLEPGIAAWDAAGSEH